MTTSDSLYTSAKNALTENGIMLSSAEDEFLRAAAATGGNTLAPTFNAIILQKSLINHAMARNRSRTRHARDLIPPI